VKTWAKRAVSLAMRMSQARARLQPPPAATPFTDAITGFSISWIARTASHMGGRSLVACFERAWTVPSANSRRSPPVQKALPAPVITTTRMSAFAPTASRISTSCWRIRPPKAFIRSGRLSVIVAT
jgi:hypothetical protein